MDKQNYTLREFKIQALKEYIFSQEDKLAKELEHRIFKRKRILKSVNLLIKAIFLYFCDQLSFQRLSDVMACRYNVVMSDTAWRKQFLKAAPILLEWTQQQQEQEKLETLGEIQPDCPSVCAIDATDFPVQGGNGTAIRVHTQFSVTEHRCVYAEITDRHGGESLIRFPLRPGELYLADRAYGRTPQLAYALEQKAHFLTRISPNQVTFYTDSDCREKISFPDLMKETSFSTVGYFKRNQQVYYVRLFGAELPKEKQKAAEKRVRRKSNRNQCKLSDRTLAYSKWIFFASTLPDSSSNAELLETYRQRWQIELHFKRIKTFLNFRKIRRSSTVYKDKIVALWLAISFLFASMQLQILCLTNFSISDFNAFSLAKAFFA